MLESAISAYLIPNFLWTTLAYWTSSEISQVKLFMAFIERIFITVKCYSLILCLNNIVRNHMVCMWITGCVCDCLGLRATVREESWLTAAIWLQASFSCHQLMTLPTLYVSLWKNYHTIIIQHRIYIFSAHHQGTESCMKKSGYCWEVISSDSTRVASLPTARNIIAYLPRITSTSRNE